MSGLSDQELYELAEVLSAMVDQIHYQHTALAAIAAKVGVEYDLDGPAMNEYLAEIRKRLRTALRSNVKPEGERDGAEVRRVRDD